MNKETLLKMPKDTLFYELKDHSVTFYYVVSDMKQFIDDEDFFMLSFGVDLDTTLNDRSLTHPAFYECQAGIEFNRLKPTSEHSHYRLVLALHRFYSEVHKQILGWRKNDD